MPIDFSDFPSVSKEAWLQQVNKDLKGKSLEDFDWQAAPGLKVTPFVHADDFAEPSVPLQTATMQWDICEKVDATNPELANKQILEALEFGAESLELHLPAAADLEPMRQILGGVYLDFVGLHFTGLGVVQNPGAVLASLQRLASENELSSNQLRGSLAYDPVNQANIVDWRYLVDLIDFAKSSFPEFRLVTIGAKGDTPEDAVEELVQLLQQGNFYLQKLIERGVSATDAAHILQFSINVGKSYFLEIAKIRAFKILWLNVLKGWKAPLEYPKITAQFSPTAYTDDLYTNMVRATTMAMSAVLGGADRLTVLPYDARREEQATYPQSFSRRIARNVQHLLKMESGFGEISDPAAGSYYIEKLTEQLANAAWNKFSKSL